MGPNSEKISGRLYGHSEGLSDIRRSQSGSPAEQAPSNVCQEIKRVHTKSCALWCFPTFPKSACSAAFRLLNSLPVSVQLHYSGLLMCSTPHWPLQNWATAPLLAVQLRVYHPGTLVELLRPAFVKPASSFPALAKSRAIPLRGGCPLKPFPSPAARAACLIRFENCLGRSPIGLLESVAPLRMALSDFIVRQEMKAIASSTLDPASNA